MCSSMVRPLGLAASVQQCPAHTGHTTRSAVRTCAPARRLATSASRLTSKCFHGQAVRLVNHTQAEGRASVVERRSTSTAAAWSSIFEDVSEGRLVTVARKIKVKPDLVNERGADRGLTPLMVATVRGDPLMVKLLLDNEAKVWLPDKADWTALHYAVLKDHLPVVQLLLSAGADPRNLTRGENGYHSALNLAHSDECKKLLEDAIAGRYIPEPAINDDIRLAAINPFKANTSADTFSNASASSPSADQTSANTSETTAINNTTTTSNNGSNSGNSNGNSPAGDGPEAKGSDASTNESAPPAAPSGVSKMEEELLETIRALKVDPSLVKTAWEDIAGLADVKRDLELNLMGAMQRPELFSGLLQPAKGILFYGPPGTGKTMLAKAIAKKAKATFYNLSASSLGSKYVGESEKLVKLLFDEATRTQPAIIFFDEIDSVLRARQSGEEEWVRKVKNEFLVRLQEIQEGGTVYFIAATNTPSDLDEAVLRRLERKFYIPLPDTPARHSLLRKLGGLNKSEVTEDEWWQLAAASKGYSAADIKTLCTQAARAPLTEAFEKEGGFEKVEVKNLRALKKDDYTHAIRIVRPSVSQETIVAMEAWGQAAEEPSA